MTINFEQLQSIWNLHKKLDDLLESLQFNQKELKYALNDVFEFLQKQIGISSFFVETKNEKLINTLFTYGNCNENIKLRAPQLENVNEIVSFSIADQIWFGQPIDVDNHIIGIIGIGFDIKNSKPVDKEYYSELLNTISELLDSFFYSIHNSSVKHSMIMGLQEALADQNISMAIDKAIQILYKSVKFKHLLMIYQNREFIVSGKSIKYYYYEEMDSIAETNENPSSALDRLIRSQSDIIKIEPVALKDYLHFDNITMSYLTKTMSEKDSIGFIAIETKDNQPLSVLGQELIQIFTEELRQRLVDLNREINMLKKYFSNATISRLISTSDYEERYLKAREAEIGIIFADISGFTKMSEQILKDPDRITSFINKWSQGVVSRVFPLGACLDKLIGDCAMLLFGPPFYEASKEEIVRHMLQASQQIVNFTKYFLRLPENADIQAHPDFEKFGVSIGVNISHCVVGLIGPNQDLTAFSSGVNITARLQGLANSNQILVTEPVKTLAEHCGNWKFSEKCSTMVKNVEKPLGYYQLLAGRSE